MALAIDIEALIPHSGSMCLLQAVEQWDEKGICCTACSHRQLDNPLRLDGQLSAVHLVEYGAQAMAVHGGLLAQKAGQAIARPGMLVALKSVQLLVDSIDQYQADLQVTATSLLNTADGQIYQFEVKADDQLLVKGRATVVQV